MMKQHKPKKVLGLCITVLAGMVSVVILNTKLKKKNDVIDSAGKPDSSVKRTFYETCMKRCLDVALSFLGFVVLSPVLLIISVAIVLDDPGPVLFTQKRVGRNKTYFKLHKFRSMKVSAPHDTPTHMLEKPDQHITRVGRILRKYSLDELPQIWDIWMGHLAVCGPRPALWNQNDLIAERDKYGANDVKPGLTGWAQINGRDELEISEKAKLDGQYAAAMRKGNISGFVMDVTCFVRTIASSLRHEGVVEGGTGTAKIKTAGRNYTDGAPDQQLIGQIGFGEPVEVDESANKKVLITGAGSYIGESFEKYTKQYYRDNFNIDTLDMVDGTWKNYDFSGYDIVYHVAGIAHADVGNVSDEVKETYYKVNTDLAMEAAKKAKEQGVKTFIFMSSMIVYGDSAPYGKRKVIGFRTVPRVANFYGDSKLQADVAVRTLAEDDFKVMVLRPPMIYGKDSKGNYPALAKAARKLPVFPNVENERSMLYVENLCEFLCQIMLVREYKENAIVLMPQNGGWIKITDMVKDIAEASGNNIIITNLLNRFVWIGTKVPGKVSKLVNKAFGNLTYEMAISKYPGINYVVVDLKETVKRTEGTAADIRKHAVRPAITNNHYSVLMSVYKKDNPKFLRTAIDSMLEQELKPEQFVIVKDGPLTENLNAVIDGYKAKYEALFTVVSLARNGGLGNALNQGMKVCRNELVARMDADDISKPHRCKKQVALFMKKPDLDIVGTQIDEFVGERSQIISRRSVPVSNQEIKIFARRRSPFNHPTVMYRKSVLDSMGGYSAYGRKEDLDLFIRMINEGCNSQNLEESLLWYRTGSDNLKRRKAWINCKEYIQIMYDFYKKGYIKAADLGYVAAGQLTMFILPKRVAELLSKKLLRE